MLEGWEKYLALGQSSSFERASEESLLMTPQASPPKFMTGWSIWLWFCSISYSSMGWKPNCTWISAGIIYDCSQITCSKAYQTVPKSLQIHWAESLMNHRVIRYWWHDAQNKHIPLFTLMQKCLSEYRLQNLGVPQRLIWTFSKVSSLPFAEGPGDFPPYSGGSCN